MPVPPHIPVVLFDMDGVLVDVSRSYRRAIEETVYHFTGREVHSKLIQRYKDRGGFNDDWALTHTIIGDYGMEVPRTRVISEFQRRYRGEDWDGFIMEERPLIQTSTLQELKQNGHVLGIVTGRPRGEARWAIDRFGWESFFSLLVPRELQEDRGKPDPFPLLYALGILHAAGLQIQAEETVYIGDSVDDMNAACSAGMLAIGYAPPYLDTDVHGDLLRSYGAHLIVKTLNVLPEKLSFPEEWIP